MESLNASGMPYRTDQPISNAPSFAKNAISKGLEKYSEVKGLTSEGTLKESDAGTMSTMLDNGVAGSHVSDSSSYDAVATKQDSKTLSRFLLMDEKKQLHFLHENGRCTQYMTVSEYKKSPEYTNMQRALIKSQSEQVKTAVSDRNLTETGKALVRLGGSALSVGASIAALKGSQIVKESIDDVVYHARTTVDSLKEKLGGSSARIPAFIEDEAEFITERKAHLLDGYKAASNEKKEVLLEKMQTAYLDMNVPAPEREANRQALRTIKESLVDSKKTEKERILQRFPEMDSSGQSSIIDTMVKNKEQYQDILNGLQDMKKEEFSNMSPNDREVMKSEINKQMHGFLLDEASTDTVNWYNNLLGALLDIEKSSQSQKQDETSKQSAIGLGKVISGIGKKKFSLEDQAKIETEKERLVEEYYGSDDKASVKANYELIMANNSSRTIRETYKRALEEINNPIASFEEPLVELSEGITVEEAIEKFEKKERTVEEELQYFKGLGQDERKDFSRTIQERLNSAEGEDKANYKKVLDGITEILLSEFKIGQ